MFMYAPSRSPSAAPTKPAGIYLKPWSLYPNPKNLCPKPGTTHPEPGNLYPKPGTLYHPRVFQPWPLYRGTSLKRSRHPVGPYSRTVPRLLWRSWGGGGFL